MRQRCSVCGRVLATGQAECICGAKIDWVEKHPQVGYGFSYQTALDWGRILAEELNRCA